MPLCVWRLSFCAAPETDAQTEYVARFVSRWACSRGLFLILLQSGGEVGLCRTDDLSAKKHASLRAIKARHCSVVLCSLMPEEPRPDLFLHSEAQATKQKCRARRLPLVDAYSRIAQHKSAVMSFNLLACDSCLAGRLCAVGEPVRPLLSTSVLH